MKYRIRWCDLTEYETEIEAPSALEALSKFHEEGVDSCEPTGFCEQQEDSIEVSEVAGSVASEPDSDSWKPFAPSDQAICDDEARARRERSTGRDYR